MLPENPPGTLRPTRRRFWRGGCIFVPAIVTFAVVLSLVLWYLHTRGNLRAEIEAHEDAIRAQGLPVTLDELQAYYPAVSDEENAALVYLEAFRHLARVTNERWEEHDELVNWLADVEPGAPYDEARQAMAEAFLAASAPLFEALQQASQRPRARFPVDLTQGMLAEFPHLKHLRESARIVALRSYHCAHVKDLETVVQSQRQILHMAESIRYEPTFIPHLVRVAIHGVAADALANALSVTPLPSGALQTLQQSYTSAEDPHAIVRAVAGERASNIGHIRLLSSGKRGDEQAADDPAIDTAREASNLPGLGFFWLHQEIGLFEFYEAQLAAVGSDWPDWIAAIPALREHADNIPRHQVMVKILVPVLASVAQTFARGAASLRMAQSALAIERYRHDHGTLPEILDQLVPEYLDAVPEDPYDGAPIRYRRTDPGYILYSVYMDLNDDGAVKAEKDEENNWIGDWVFEVRR